MIVWLVLAIGVQSNPIHVGNFPDINSCMAAAQSNKSITTGVSANAPRFSVNLVCVQANTGKAGDPPPPP
jgi:hypothetical protein